MDEHEFAALLDDLQNNQGNTYAHWWNEDWTDDRSGTIRLSRGPGKMAIVQEGSRVPVHCHALHRALVDKDLWKDTTRILYATGCAC